MKKSVKIIIIIASILLVVGIAVFVLKRGGSNEAVAVKASFPDDSPEKFLEYLKRVLTPEQLDDFKGKLAGYENSKLHDPESYDAYSKAAEVEAQALSIPKEVALYRSMLWIMTLTANPTLDKKLWNKIHTDSIFMYRKGLSLLG